MENQDKINFASLFEHMLDGFAYCKMLFDEAGNPDDFVYLAVNPAFEKLTGLKEIVGKKVTEVIPSIKRDQPDLLALYGRVAVSGTPEKKEIYFKPLDIWLSLSIYSPEKGCFVVFFENITEQKKAEERINSRNEEVRTKIGELENTKKAMLNLLEDARDLQEILKTERDRVAAIVSSMGEGLLVIDKEFNVTIINKAGQELLEASDLGVIGKKWTEVVHAYHENEETPVGDRSFSRAINEKKTFVTNVNDNHYYQTRTGRRFPVASVTSPLFSGGEVIGAIKVFRDVTHEKEEKTRIEAIVEERTKELSEKNIALESAQAQISEGWLALQNEKARLTSSINALPLGFLIVGVNHQILVANSKTKEILGTSDLLSDLKQLVDLFEGTGFDFKTVCNHCRNDKNPYENKDINFRGKFLRIFSVPVLTGEDLLGTVVLIEDITDMKVLERSRDEFFSIASHELRTPLTSIRGNTSLIMDYFMAELKDDNLKDMIKDVHESAVRLIGIVNDFLDLSRLEQKRMEFKKEDIDLMALSSQVMDELGTNANGAVELKVSGETLHTLADKNKVKEVLINLVGNALKFTENGSVEVILGKRDQFTEIRVKDTGRGIPIENQSLLFRKFQQAGTSLMTRDTTKGTGLGLYISKLMVEGMGGSIWLESSAQDSGSTFVFTLPTV